MARDQRRLGCDHLAAHHRAGRRVSGRPRDRGRRGRGRGARPTRRKAAAEAAAPGRHEAAGQGLQVPRASSPRAGPKEADLASVDGVSFAGLTDGQKTTALQALNERDCECGCGMGKIAGCLKKDPNCPRSPNLAKLAIDMVEAGQGARRDPRRHRRQAEAGGRARRRRGGRAAPAAKKVVAVATTAPGRRRPPRSPSSSSATFSARSASGREPTVKEI